MMLKNELAAVFILHRATPPTAPTAAGPGIASIHAHTASTWSCPKRGRRSDTECFGKTSALQSDSSVEKRLEEQNRFVLVKLPHLFGDVNRPMANILFGLEPAQHRQTPALTGGFADLFQRFRNETHFEISIARGKIPAWGLTTKSVQCRKKGPEGRHNPSDPNAVFSSPIRRHLTFHIDARQPPFTKSSQFEVIMAEEPRTAMEATDTNPHFRPAIMRWNKVEIIAPEGMEFAILYDSDGLLSITARPKGSQWKDGYEPKDADIIKPGEISWRVENGARGPAIGHEFQPNGSGKCAICNK
jgi:hypothetical protein